MNSGDHHGTFANSRGNALHRPRPDVTNPEDAAHRGVEDLVKHIFDYIDHYNDNPKPFVWTARANDILEKVKRARAALIIRNLHDALH